MGGNDGECQTPEIIIFRSAGYLKFSNNNMTEEFDGVLRFSNNSDEDFVVLWNNKEYLFPAKTCSPMLIENETLEAMQEIRKKFAYKWAEREWFKGKEYKKFVKMGGALPPLRDDKVSLEPLVQMCLSPLPVGKVKTKKLSGDERSFKSTKAVKGDTDLNYEFREDTQEDKIVKLGPQ